MIASIVVIHRLLWIIVVDPKISSDLIVKRYIRALAIALDKEWLSIPRVETTMILCLSDHVENQVSNKKVSSSHSVVEIDACPRAVETDILSQCALLGLGLKIA